MPSAGSCADSSLTCSKISMAFWYCSSWAAYAATFSRHLLAELKPRTRAERKHSQREMTRHLGAPSRGMMQGAPRAE